MTLIEFQAIWIIYIAAAVIMFVSIIQIASRLQAIKKSQETLVKIQTMQAITSGALLSKTCKKCDEVYAVELVLDKDVCPKCGAENV